MHTKLAGLFSAFALLGAAPAVAQGIRTIDPNAAAQADRTVILSDGRVLETVAEPTAELLAALPR